ncbi:hypothetical protein [Devosia sp. A16]|uniref:hypothetical protein n=1 Tax=Devosia sp. A16 TaxID=1736675 RepID=UPI0006D846A5|nr:hypothetical protein [Devosia sp. A16]
MSTMYFAQGFKAKGKKLEPEAPRSARTAEDAIAAAQRLEPIRAGVWAYSADIDIETDTYDEPRELYRAGQLPAGLGE